MVAQGICDTRAYGRAGVRRRSARGGTGGRGRRRPARRRAQRRRRRAASRRRRVLLLRCMPSKALLRPGELLAEARRVPGVPVGDGLDVAAVLARRDEVIHDGDDSSQLPWLEERGVTLVRGRGRLDGERRVQWATTCSWAARRSSSRPAAAGLAAARRPGGGATVVESRGDDRVLAAGESRRPRRRRRRSRAGTGVVDARARGAAGGCAADPRPRGAVRVGRGRGVAAGAGRRRADRDPRRLGLALRGHRRSVGLADGESVSGAELLVAVGRKPATEELGLETVGLEPGKPVEVGSNLRSPRHDWLYAIGDANGRAQLTHMGKYQGRLAADAILGKPAALVSDGPLSPRVVFSDPQVAAVGHTVSSAESAGLVVRPVDVETGGTAGASFVAAPRPGRRGSSSTRRGASSSAPRSAASRSPSGSMPRRSPSSPRSRSTGSPMPSPPSRPAARSGCSCSRPRATSWDVSQDSPWDTSQGRAWGRGGRSATGEDVVVRLRLRVAGGAAGLGEADREPGGRGGAGELLPAPATVRGALHATHGGHERQPALAWGVATLTTTVPSG